ncbi:sulfite exporter TauE/SafE family protein [Metallosphaera tengchongensis]|uniref:Probable membrane transporter protein n=1 Tax=Metallosphaera tengchongensis TaxID=1532350 RepID=A0A6N0NVE8_9CREN|nr:sulfite exporter TauE/SafE family protein [Metallosphaera tengchongensis]QKR00786.1 sulfite exporter TauE/SafE family protein [Metallosphaera tengchongensis]
MVPVYLLVLLGLAVGALTGITGSSGVLVVVPALSYLGLDFVQSVGVSLLVDVITTLSVIPVYFKFGNVDVRTSSVLGGGAILGAQLGSRVALLVPERYLELAFVVFAGYMAYVSFRRSRNPNIKVRRINLKGGYALAFVLSVGIGTVTGTLGASGGIMFIAVMMLLFSVDVKKMVGTATLAMLLSATSGSIAYLSLGRIDLLASAIIGVTALTSGYFFARIANRMRPSVMYSFLGSVFVITVVSELARVI